jgi:zinc transporter ZupT
MEIILWGALASLVAGLMTGVGALPVLLGRSISRPTSDALLGFAAGVMLSASFFSLIIPGIDAAEDRHGSLLIAALIAGAGILLGGMAIVAALNETLPHEHFKTKGAKVPIPAASRGSGFSFWPSPSTTSPKAWPWASGFGGDGLPRADARHRHRAAEPARGAGRRRRAEGRGLRAAGSPGPSRCSPDCSNPWAG